MPETNPLGYLILVKTAITQRERYHLATQFARALLKKQHKIMGIYFIGNGVTHAIYNDCNTDSTTKVNASVWYELNKEFGVPLWLCPTSLADYNQSTKDCDNAFTQSGLGQLMTAMMQADRVMEF